nr:immunoglobulin heavy chain junction region [Macaca mulatta]
CARIRHEYSNYLDFW